MQTAKNELDLEVSRIIRAPRERIWNAWVDSERLAQWWIPHPILCRVVSLDVKPGGAFITEMSEDGRQFVPHLAACFLDVKHQERLVYTNALTGGWRPADGGFVTAVIDLLDHSEGTRYRAQALHKSRADREKHEELGFHEGWGTVVAQLASFVEDQ